MKHISRILIAILIIAMMLPTVLSCAETSGSDQTTEAAITEAPALDATTAAEETMFALSDIPEDLKRRSYISDYKTLISLNRSDAGATYFCNGELIRKWASSDLPDTAQLQDIYRSDKTEIVMDQDNKGSLGFQGFLLYVFAVMLLL